MAPLIDAAINGDPLAIAELSPAVVTRKPITEEQLASLNEERPKPVAPTPIERLNIEFPNRRKSNHKPAAEMPPLTESQSATVDEIHASLVSSGIKGVGKPEVAEYVTKREALTKQATLLESSTWYRGKAHDVADKNREVALLDYEFARRTDRVGLETSTPVLNVLGLGLGGLAKTAVTKTAKGVTAGKSVFPNTTTLKQSGGGGYTASADELYDAIRASDSDVSAIASSTGFKPESIQKVKDHVFYNEHLLDRYVDYGVPATVGRFDSTIEQAQAWKRLESGTHTDADNTWLKHETAERWYEKKFNSGYSEAHDRVDSRWSGFPWETE